MQSWIAFWYYFLKKRLKITTKCLNMQNIVTQRWTFYGNLHIGKCRLWLWYLILSISIYLSAVISSYVNENMILWFHKCPLGIGFCWNFEYVCEVKHTFILHFPCGLLFHYFISKNATLFSFFLFWKKAKPEPSPRYYYM